MKKPELLPILCLGVLLLSHTLNAQKLDWALSSTSGGVNYSLCTDTAANVISTGSFVDTLSITEGNGTATLASHGLNDLFIKKNDSLGNLLWARGMGGTGYDEGLGITADADGNVFVCGWFNGTVDFDPGPSVYNLVSSGSAEIFILKLTSIGDFAWAKKVGGAGFDLGNAIAIDTAANIYIAGSFTGIADFDPGISVFNLSSSGSTDAFILKLDSAGNFNWAKKFGGSFLDEALSISIDKNQSILTTGRCTDNIDFDPGPGTYFLSTGGLTTAFVQKLDSLGDFEWAVILETTASAKGESITSDTLGNIYCTGYYQNQADFDPGTGTYFLNTANVLNYNIFVWKLDSNGAFIWANEIAQYETNGYSCIRVDKEQNIVFVGGYLGIADFDPGIDSAMASTVQGVFIVSWDMDANFLWARNLEGTSYNYATALALTPSGAIYFTGFFDAQLDLDPGYAVQNVNTVLVSLFYLERLIPCSNIQPQITASGPLTFCMGDSVQLISSSAYNYLWSNGSLDSSIVIKTTEIINVSTEDIDRCKASSNNLEITVNTLPDSAGAITGTTLLTACANQNGIVYSVNLIGGAISYSWTLPPLSTIIGGTNSNSITVDFSPYSSSGMLEVFGTNFCGAGAPSNLIVQFNPIPLAEICRATIDSASQKTILEWQKPIESYVNGYVIYRENAGAFINIDTVSNAVFSSYLDTGSHPNIQAEKYKIAVLDSCGNIGDLSAPFEHQTIRLYGSIQPGGIAKLYWTDYLGINDSSRFFNLLRDTLGNGPFNDTLASHISPSVLMSNTDLSSASHPLCRYVVEMIFNSNCTPSQRMLATKSTSRSNIKNKTTLFDSTGVGVADFDKHFQSIKIYPNPAHDLLSIQLNSKELINEIILYDLLGKTVRKELLLNTPKSNVLMNLKGIEKGVYFLNIQSGIYFYKTKLIID